MARTFDAKLADRRTTLLERSSQLQQLELTTLEQLAASPQHKTVRCNSLVAPSATSLATLKNAGVSLMQPSWLPADCAIITTASDNSAAAVQTLLQSGAIFYQNASSLLAVHALDVQPAQTILDLCAAPGGKASYIAALTNNQAELWLNDTSYDRLQKLRRVCSLLNVRPAKVTMSAGERASRQLPAEYFDRILLDAPCSGEDIRMLTSSNLEGWSLAKVKRLSELQKKLLKEAWKLLKPGGRLVYSTCSQAFEENEAVIDWFVRTHDTARITPYTGQLPANALTGLTSSNSKQVSDALQCAVRIQPSQTHISFFVCILQKCATMAEQ